ncbi:unnamed protein product, partial [Ectocarpus sp. 8 AP-2014]
LFDALVEADIKDRYVPEQAVVVPVEAPGRSVGGCDAPIGGGDSGLPRPPLENRNAPAVSPSSPGASGTRGNGGGSHPIYPNASQRPQPREQLQASLSRRPPITCDSAKAVTEGSVAVVFHVSVRTWISWFLLQR